MASLDRILLDSSDGIRCYRIEVLRDSEPGSHRRRLASRLLLLILDTGVESDTEGRGVDSHTGRMSCTDPVASFASVASATAVVVAAVADVVAVVGMA